MNNSTIDEMDELNGMRRNERLDDEQSLEMEMVPSTDSEPVSLEGFLYYRKGRSSGHSSFLWKRRFVVLDLLDGGSITVYKNAPTHVEQEHNPRSSGLRTVYSKLHQRFSMISHHQRKELFDTYIPAHVPWIVKDVANDSSTFVVEIPTGHDEGLHVGGGDGSVAMASLDVADSVIEEDEEFDEESTLPSEEVRGDLRDSMKNAMRKGKPLRLYFRCSKGSNEKTLWLKAFARMGRLSDEVRKKKNILTSLSQLGTPLQHLGTPLHLGTNRVRTRTEEGEDFARETRQLMEIDGESLETTSVDLNLTKDVEELAHGTRTSARGARKEYRVLPTSVYPHRWMTKTELREEMLLPSTEFHDLRVPGCTQKEIGSLRVEVLQCLGLPKLDRTADTDAVVYLVCGSYAFSTDIIQNRTNPMWLRKTRRACIIPLFHAYAKLYIGVFDDDGRKIKDDFAGRVVLDLARLRPGSTYDVTLPLRLSTHVYSRRRRGAIRVRFTLTWTTEKDALLSYIPKRPRVPLPQNSKPKTDVTVLCADPRAFRNIAITVHGAHLPGRFTFPQMRATIREFNFTRKWIFTSIRLHQRYIRLWYYPTMSAFVFLSWMHCVYANSFSLVPAYLMCYLMLLLMRSYAKHGIDGPGQRGFVPPSWEEMFLALIKGGDPDYHAIEPLDLGLRPNNSRREQTPDYVGDSFDGDMFNYKVTTHDPKGKALFKTLGFLPNEDMAYLSVEEDHLEFPFANGTDYPKFSVKECLVKKKGEITRKESSDNEDHHSSDMDSAQLTTSSAGDFRTHQPSERQRAHHNRFERRFTLPDMEIPDLLHKDSSGMKDKDDEEDNFATRRAVMAEGKRAVGKLGKAANELTEATGLNYVVDPIRSGISSGIDQVTTGVNKGMNLGMHGLNQVTTGMNKGMSNLAHPKAATGPGRPMPELNHHLQSRTNSFDSDITGLPSLVSGSYADHVAVTELIEVRSIPSNGGNESKQNSETIDPALAFPQQNIDIEGPSSGKKLTDDLAEIKDKMHEMTWHLFDDQTYVLKNPDAVYFGQAKRSEKRRNDVSQKLDKLLLVGQYTHPNPFIARVGLFVEPIIGSAYSFLCLFRALFNVFTWRDPMLTFWVSFFGGLITIILFFFPWRIFLGFLGVLLVGPHNWLIRVLREQGRLPPARMRSRRDEKDEKNEKDLPSDQPVFSSVNGGTSTPVDVDPREVHRIVVPYSPLSYQRFYDWPPEPQYAQVKPASLDEQRGKPVQATLKRRNGSGGGGGFGRFRRRFHRRAQSDGLPPINPRRRRSSGDAQLPRRSNGAKNE